MCYKIEGISIMLVPSILYLKIIKDILRRNNMKEWTREERYRTILEASNEEITELKKIVDSCPYRQKFHIQPTTGLLNDPNGFSYYNGEYHLFYQWFPLGPVHGIKHWYHVSSKDLFSHIFMLHHK